MRRAEGISRLSSGGVYSPNAMTVDDGLRTGVKDDNRTCQQRRPSVGHSIDGHRKPSYPHGGAAVHAR